MLHQFSGRADKGVAKQVLDARPLLQMHAAVHRQPAIRRVGHPQQRPAPSPHVYSQLYCCSALTNGSDQLMMPHVHLAALGCMHTQVQNPVCLAFAEA